MYFEGRDSQWVALECVCAQTKCYIKLAKKNRSKYGCWLAVLRATEASKRLKKTLGEGWQIKRTESRFILFLKYDFLNIFSSFLSVSVSCCFILFFFVCLGHNYQRNKSTLKYTVVYFRVSISIASNLTVYINQRTYWFAQMCLIHVNN